MITHPTTPAVYHQGAAPDLGTGSTPPSAMSQCLTHGKRTIGRSELVARDGVDDNLSRTRTTSVPGNPRHIQLSPATMTLSFHLIISSYTCTISQIIILSAGGYVFCRLKSIADCGSDAFSSEGERVVHAACETITMQLQRFCSFIITVLPPFPLASRIAV